MNRMKIFPIAFLIVMTLLGCSRNTDKAIPATDNNEPDPVVKEGGKWIEFPANSNKVKLFVTAKAEFKHSVISLSAPATVIGRVQRSSTPNSSSLILFNSPEITGIYSSYLQNQTLLKTARIELDRVTDLFKNGAATGKELNDASSELLNIQTALAENEARLKESGLEPENLNSAPVGTVWLICDLPESELNIIKKNQRYKLEFPSFPNETFMAKLDVIADVMNTQTRKIRIRLSLADPREEIRPGMYAEVMFETDHSGLMVPRTSVISANSEYYVFVKNSERVFERRKVILSSESGDYIEIADGLKAGEEIVSTHVYLLKGIDLGI